MATRRMLNDRELDLENGFEHAFFRNYVPQKELHVDANIGNYPASIYGVWEPMEVGGCNICGRGSSRLVDLEGNCSHPFTLHPFAREIAYLLKCRGLPDTAFWMVAEEEWKEQVKATQKMVDAKETKVTELILEIYQLVGFAMAFQSLLMTVAVSLPVSYSYMESCNGKLWWFLALSIFATVVTAAGVKYKIGLVGVFQIALNEAKTSLNECQYLLSKLTVTEGPGFDLGPCPKNKSKLGNFKSFLEKRIYPAFEYSTFILVCLILFGIITGISLRYICRS